MSTDTLDQTAREAIASACADVRDADRRPRRRRRPGRRRPSRRRRPGGRGAPRRDGPPAERGAARPRHQAVVGQAAVERRRPARRERARPGLDHAAGDLIVAAQAGTRLADVQQAVGAAPASGWPSTRPSPAPASAALLAANTSGPRRVAIGTRPRPPHRHHRGARRRRRGQGRWPGREERRRLRPRQADDRLRSARSPSSPRRPSGCTRCRPPGWVTAPVDDPAEAQRLVQSVLHAQAVPAAVEVDWAARRRRAGQRPARGTRGRRRRSRRRPSGRCSARRRPSRPRRPRRRRDVPLGRRGHRRRPCHGAQADLRALRAGRRAGRGRARPACALRGSAGAGVATPPCRRARPSTSRRSGAERLRAHLRPARRQRRRPRRAGRREGGGRRVGPGRPRST